MTRSLNLNRKYPNSCPRLDQAHFICEGKIFIPRFYLDNRLTKLVLLLELIILSAFWVLGVLAKPKIGLFKGISAFILSLMLFYLILQSFLSLLTKYYAKRETKPRFWSFLYKTNHVDLLHKYLSNRKTPCYLENEHCTRYFSKKNDI